MAEFDWYQATIPSRVDDVLECLLGLDDDLRVSHQRGMHGYAQTAVLGSEAWGSVARVQFGGSHEYPNAVVSGDWAVKGAQLIRASFPVHKVSRVDVREDFDGADAYDRMQAQLVDVATRMKVRVGTAGDHLVTLKGRTMYLGSTKSEVRMRLYDKAEEMRSQLVPPAFLQGLDTAAWYARKGVPEYLTRLEAQIRPHGEAKSNFATIDPIDALGSARWMREAWKQVCGLELQPVKVGKGWRQSDDERSYRWMLAAYGPLLRRMHESHGGWDCVGLQIGQDLSDGGRG